jgi:membrane protease YdiL (CAAX protease family)
LDESERDDIRRAPWTVRDMVFGGLAGLGLFGLGLVLASVLVLLGQTVAPTLPSPAVLMPMVFALEAMLILPAWWWGPRKYGGGWQSLGFRVPPALKTLAVFGVGLVVILLINVAWGAIQQDLGLEGQPNVLPLFGEGIRGLLVALFLGGVVAPIAEEVFFRGFLYAGMRDRWGMIWGLVVSSVIFSVVHVVPGVLLPIALIGVVLALAYEMTDSLWLPIALHSALNSLAFIGTYIAQSNPELLGG